MDRKTIFIKRLNFATLSAWLIASVFMAITALLWFGEDFRGYYAAARVALAGGNPYDYHTLAPVLLKITGRIGSNPYYYAPWFAWFIIPLAWLPFNIARGLWMGFNLVLWSFSLWRLSSLFNWPKTDWRRWLLYLLATYIFALTTWRYEQAGILLFALLLGVLFALRNKNETMAGIWLALLLIKPNITLIPVMAIGFWLVRHRNWQPIVSMGATTLGLLVISSIVTPNWYRPFFEPGFFLGLIHVLEGPGQISKSVFRIDTTLHDWLVMFQVSTEMALVISALAFVIGLAILAVIVWKSDSVIQVTVASLLINFAISPYAVHYDYPLLTLVLFWTLSLTRYGQQQWIKITGAVIILFITSVPAWEHHMSNGYWILIGLLGLTVLNWYNADKSQIPLALL